MILSSIEDFIKSIPTAEGTEFSTLKPYVDAAEFNIRTTLTGDALFDHIAALGPDDLLRIHLCKLVAYYAYRDAIPFVDLIQTNNGFAVVSNSNHAPASKERVERLIGQCVLLADDAVDNLILAVMNSTVLIEKWKLSPVFKSLTDCLFLTGVDLASFSEIPAEPGKLPNKRAFLQKAKPSMIANQDVFLAPNISRAYLNELIIGNAEKTLTEKNNMVVASCKAILSLLHAGKNNDAKTRLNQCLASIDLDIDSYPTYKLSKEYALRTGTRYENKQSDPTFFFGM